MTIYSAREGYCRPAPAYEPPMPDREFLEKALAAIRKRRGLIHGSWSGKGGVCAMGAFGTKHDGAVVSYPLGNALQNFNDSMPEVSKAVRRRKVISWIENRLAALPSHNPTSEHKP